MKRRISDCLFGLMFVIGGVIAVYQESISWGYYGDNYGIFAKIAGVLMVVMGLSIIFSKNKK